MQEILKIINRSILLFFFSLSCLNVLAQEKLEKESRLCAKHVNTDALNFIDSLELNTKVKWYKEEGIDKESIEAKFKLKSIRYSIEFDTLGKVEDIEVDIKWEDLDLSVKNKIEAYFQEDCLKFELSKIQIQYSGNPSALIYTFRNNKSTEEVIVKYEVVVKCKSKKGIHLFEYLFDDTGKLISKYRIRFNNSSHLEY